MCVVMYTVLIKALEWVLCGHTLLCATCYSKWSHLRGHTSVNQEQPALSVSCGVLGEVVLMCAVEQIILVKKWIKSVTCSRCYEIHTYTAHDNIAQGLVM